MQLLVFINVYVKSVFKMFIFFKLNIDCTPKLSKYVIVAFFYQIEYMFHWHHCQNEEIAVVKLCTTNIIDNSEKLGAPLGILCGTLYDVNKHCFTGCQPIF